MGAYVSLLEYNGIEGMILLSELSRRRIRSITKLIKVCRFWALLGRASPRNGRFWDLVAAGCLVRALSGVDRRSAAKSR